MEFLERHPRASVFHTPEWLEALRRTYGYHPVVLTMAAPGMALRGGLVFCQVDSWLTGRRMVSLPFSDHCEPLVSSDEELRHLVLALDVDGDSRSLRYIEIRSTGLPAQSEAYLETAQTFCFHRLDLRPGQDDLFRGFHKDCVQRKIRRAEREGLSCEDGRSDTLLLKFYELLLLTRRRQRLPPQPLKWFRNLIACMRDKVSIRVASKDGHAVASVLTLRFKDTLTYKYGVSDRRFSNLGGTQLLLWRAIEEARRDGVTELDMGRSDIGNQGLINFKDRWGAARLELSYLRLRGKRSYLGLGRTVLFTHIAKQIGVWAPDSLIATAGRVLYRHLA